MKQYKTANNDNHGVVTITSTNVKNFTVWKDDSSYSAQIKQQKNKKGDIT